MNNTTNVSSISPLNMTDNLITKHYMLAFRRSSAYPKPKSYVVISEKQLLDRIHEIENSRDETDRQYSKIQPILQPQHQGMQLNQLLYKTKYEIEYEISTQIVLEVDSLVQSHENEMFVRCRLPMFIWPKDVPENEQHVDIKDQNAIVVDLILCDSEEILSDVKPTSAENLYGIVDAKLTKKNNGLKIYRTFRASSKPIDSQFIKLAINYGLKEFSSLVSAETLPPVATQHQQSQLDTHNNHTSSNDFDDIMDISKIPSSTNIDGNDYMTLLKKHHLYEYTKRLFLAYKENFDMYLNKKSNITNDDFEDSVYFDFFDTMLRTDATSHINLHPFDFDQNIDELE